MCANSHVIYTSSWRIVATKYIPIEQSSSCTIHSAQLMACSRLAAAPLLFILYYYFIKRAFPSAYHIRWTEQKKKFVYICSYGVCACAVCFAHYSRRRHRFFACTYLYTYIANGKDIRYMRYQKIYILPHKHYYKNVCTAQH